MSTHTEQFSAADPAILAGLFRALHTHTLRDQRSAGDGGQAFAELANIPSQAMAMMLHACPEGTPNKHLLLHVMTLARTADHLQVVVPLLHHADDWMQVGQVFAPLMQHSGWPIAAVFPGLLHMMDRPAIASPALDLANFLFRKKRVKDHPAAERKSHLITLLSAVIHRLEQLERSPQEFGENVEDVQRVLSEAVAIAVSLCDALALIGDDTAIAKLSAAMQVRHRRVQCEAAGALARFGDVEGQERLVELASEPSVRLRAIAYADELGLLDEIDPRYQTDAALAEAELAVWLCQPSQMAVPPTSIEVVDMKRMLWPGYSDPVDCFLVRFEYDLGPRHATSTVYSNIGIAGPVTHAFAADMGDLPMDDIYAAYAGWTAEHPDIFTVAIDQMQSSHRRLLAPIDDHLRREGYENVVPAGIGFLLDEHAGLFSAHRNDVNCVVASDGFETVDFAIEGRHRPLTPTDAWNIFMGRKMLRTFN
ncbi:MAG: HEAT repeat domain-containing protein [Planctomycetota bacterium]